MRIIMNIYNLRIKINSNRIDVDYHIVTCAYLLVFMIYVNLAKRKFR